MKTHMPNTSPRARFCEHRCGARARGIPFLLTFEEWMKIWIDSGHWQERGLGRGKYNMARFGDVGPYAVDNVKIIKHEENSREGNKGKTVSIETRNKISVKRLGSFNGSREQSAKNAYKMGKANEGRVASLETRARMRAAHKRRFEALNG